MNESKFNIIYTETRKKVWENLGDCPRIEAKILNRIACKKILKKIRQLENFTFDGDSSCWYEVESNQHIINN